MLHSITGGGEDASVKVADIVRFRGPIEPFLEDAPPSTVRFWRLLLEEFDRRLSDHPNIVTFVLARGSDFEDSDSDVSRGRAVVGGSTRKAKGGSKGKARADDTARPRKDLSAKKVFRPGVHKMCGVKVSF